MRHVVIVATVPVIYPKILSSEWLGPDACLYGMYVHLELEAQFDLFFLYTESLELVSSCSTSK